MTCGLLFRRLYFACESEAHFEGVFPGVQLRRGGDWGLQYGLGPALQRHHAGRGLGLGAASRLWSPQILLKVSFGFEELSD